jgi:hypothetical protein
MRLNYSSRPAACEAHPGNVGFNNPASVENRPFSKRAGAAASFRKTHLLVGVCDVVTGWRREYARAVEDDSVVFLPETGDKLLNQIETWYEDKQSFTGQLASHDAMLIG